MKKLLVSALAITMMFTACSSGGESPSDNPVYTPGSSSVASNEKQGKLKASVTPAEGWKMSDPEKTQSPTYACQDTNKSRGANVILIAVNLPSDMKTLEGYTNYYLETMKELYGDGIFTIITKTTVNNALDAIEFSFESPALAQKKRLIFTLRDSWVYIIQCTSRLSDYDKVSADFQAMIDTFTLE